MQAATAVDRGDAIDHGDAVTDHPWEATPIEACSVLVITAEQYARGWSELNLDNVGAVTTKPYRLIRHNADGTVAVHNPKYKP